MASFNLAHPVCMYMLLFDGVLYTVTFVISAIVDVLRAAEDFNMYQY